MESTDKVDVAIGRWRRGRKMPKFIVDDFLKTKDLIIFPDDGKLYTEEEFHKSMFFTDSEIPIENVVFNELL